MVCNHAHVVAGIGAAILGAFLIHRGLKCCKLLKGRINSEISLDNPKVVHCVKKSEITEEKTAYCRCWKSKKFPYCDGAHNAHNSETNDNVGPLVINQ